MTLTETRKPPRCHYDRALRQRVTGEHRDDCPSHTGGDCLAGGRGCAPCTAPHCLVCGREHATLEQPETCAECVGKIRDDLVELGRDYADLAIEAIAGGHDGRLTAAAPIPGGTAAVLRGPTVRLQQMHTFRGYASAHLKNDPVPPLAVLADLEDAWRSWFGHTPAAKATVAGALRYFGDQLDHMANGLAEGAPDFLAFTRSIRDLRAQLERALHDEQEPEQGVECFECGDQLVRRFRDPKRCRHQTPARAELQRALVRQQRGQDWLRVVGSYPEVDVTEQDLAAARGPSASLVAAARRPCAKCQDRQGGLDDPRAGRSWECPGCRKAYDVGEYANAVRRDLLENGDQGDGWIHVRAAADAATDVVGMVVTEALVRKWLDRGKVGGLCVWTAGRPWGLRLVYWPDVVTEAIAAVARMLAAAEERRRRAEQDAALLKAVKAGEDPEVVAKRLGITKQRLERLLDTVAA